MHHFESDSQGSEAPFGDGSIEHPIQGPAPGNDGLAEQDSDTSGLSLGAISVRDMEENRRANQVHSAIEIPMTASVAADRLCNAEDACNVYRFLLGREIEDQKTAAWLCGKSLWALLTTILASDEFHKRVLPSVYGFDAPETERRMSTFPDDLAAWASEALPLSHAGKAKVLVVLSWPRAVRSALADPDFQSTIQMDDHVRATIEEDIAAAVLASADKTRKRLEFIRELGDIGFDPGVFFDYEYYSESQNLEDDQNPLLHYIKVGAERLADPYPLFDTAYYCELIKGDLAGCRTPLEHFIRFGQSQKLSPHPLFDPTYYAETNPDSINFSDGLFEHFIRHGGAEMRKPHPLFDPRWYLSKLAQTQSAQADAAQDNPLIHYVMFGAKEKIDPHPNFSVAYYLAHNPDVFRVGGEALYHYARYGAREGRSTVPNRHVLVRRPLHWRHGNRPKLRLYHVLHEATRTDAPYILLRIVEHFARDPDIENVVLIDRGGPLISAFREVASTLELDDVRSFELHEFETIGKFLDDFRGPVPAVALFNSACNGHFLPLFGRRGIPVVYLVHELASAFPADHFSELYKGAQWVIYPARFVRDRNRETSRIPSELWSKERVIPQGLLHPHLLAIGGRDVDRSAFRRELGAPDDALIVLGCGTLDLRKGLDLFTATAIAVASGWDTHPPVFFVWIGGGKTDAHSPYYYAMRDARNTGREDTIVVLGEKSNVDMYFRGADLLFVSSREDPFPCIVHEAMASGVPVVAFANAGGAPEALEGGAGVVVPYADVMAATREIRSLLLSPERRGEIATVARRKVEEEYDFNKYCDALAPYISNATRDRVKIRQVQPTKSKGLPVYFMTPDWRVNGVNSFAQMLVEGLTARDFEAQIVFTSRDPFFQQEWFDPAARYSFAVNLAKNSKVSERWLSIEDFLVRHRPCIFVPNYYYVASAIAPRLS